MILRYILTFSFFFIITASSAQSLFIPFEMSDKRQGKEMSEDIGFFAYPFRGKVVDLRDFKKKYPKLKAPDNIKIELPSVFLEGELTILMGLIQGKEPNMDALIIWLASDYHTNEVVFFLDKNLDRNFNTETDIVKLKSTDAPYQVILNSEPKNISNIELALMVPHKKQKKTKIVNLRKHSKIIDRFAIGANLGVGIGNLYYQYNNLERGFPTWYTINFTKKIIGLNLSYNTARFIFGIESSYQNTFSYTSYLNIRHDLPEVIIDPNGTRRVIDNVFIERNIDRHPVHLFQYAASVSLRIHPIKGMEIQPFFTVGQTSYKPGIYESDRYDDNFKHKLPATTYYKTGLRFEFPTYSNSTLYLDIGVQFNKWRPDGYFEELPLSDLDIESKDWVLLFGYRKGLGK